MSHINIIGTMVKADEEKSEIKSKLEEIRKMRNSFNIDLSRVTNLIDKDKLNKDEMKRETERCKIIAKLSFDLFMDYEYYREFSIKNDSQFVNCAEELKSLGYELRESDEWVNVRRPNIDTIIDQIFMSHLCQSILTRCVSCDAITRDGQSVCDNCLNESNEKRIMTIVEKDINNETDKRKCESLIPLNRSFYDKCANCCNCGSNKEIVDEGMCGDCFSARYSDLTCQYRLCGESNISSDKYYKACEIEKSSVLIVDTPICRCKGHIPDQPNETSKKYNEEEIIDPIIKFKEAVINRENKSQDIIIEKCGFCETEIEPDEDQCSVCNEPVKDIISRMERKSKEVNDIENNRKPKIENGSVKKDVDTRSVKQEMKENEFGVINRNVNEAIITDPLQDCGNSNSKTKDNSEKNPNYTLLSKNKDKWLCTSCTYLNSYDFFNCHVCENKIKEFGIWICEKCECMNEAAVNKCSACENENSRMKSSENKGKQDYNNNKNNRQEQQINTRNNNKQKEGNRNNKNTQPNETNNKHLEKEKEKNTVADDLPKWTCWKEDCKQLNSIDSKFCGKCMLQRDPPSDGTDLMKMMLQGKRVKIWFCWRKNCKQSNTDTNNFCHQCKLQRRPPENAADLVKKNDQGKITEVWICQKCDRCNKKEHHKCQSSNCGAFRFYIGTLWENENKSMNRMNCIGGESESHKTPSMNIDHSSRNRHSDETGFIDVNPNQWRCWYCKKSNESIFEYCQYCRLERHGSSEQGATVHLKSQNQDKRIWVCYKCHKYNELSATSCAGKGCSQLRFTGKNK